MLFEQKKMRKSMEDYRKIPIFAHRTMDVFHLLGLGYPRSEELSGTWQLFFVPVERGRKVRAVMPWGTSRNLTRDEP